MIVLNIYNFDPHPKSILVDLQSCILFVLLLDFMNV